MSRRALTLALSLLAGLTTATPAFAGHAPADARVGPRAALAGPRVVATAQGPVTTLKLANGLTVILKENHAAPVVTWVVAYKVGSREEPRGATGSAHLLEHMLFKGTKTFGKGQIAQLLTRNGAGFNASTWYDMTNYYETYAADRLELGLAIEASRMRDALILDGERRAEMSVVRNELEQGETNPDELLWEELGAAAYKAHPYHHPVIGFRWDVETVPTSQLKAFYDRFYRPNNAIAVLVGDFKTPEAIRLITRHFGGLAPGTDLAQRITPEPPQLAERRFTVRRRGETRAAQLGFHVPAAGHPDLPALLVLDSILSAGVTSRLHQALVETSLATDVWSFVGLNRDPSLLRVGLTLGDTAEPAKAEQVVLDELARLAREDVSPSELQRAKHRAEAEIVYENEGTEGMAQRLAYFGVVDRWERAFWLPDQVKRVGAADLRRVAGRYLGADNRTLGWYLATPEGPVPQAPANLGAGTATAAKAKVQPAPWQPYEQASKPLALATRPIRRVLPNGLTVLVLENPGSRTVAVDGFVRAGGFLDAPTQRGLAEATAAMLDQGSAGHDKLALASALADLAAELDVTADAESTRVTGKLLARDLDALLPLLAEVLTQPTFPPSELAKLKARWVARIKQAEDEAATHATRAFTQAIFPVGHPYRELPAQAAIAQVESLTSDDLRAFHRRHYGPNATALVFAGNLRAATLMPKLERLFAGWAQASRTPLAIPLVAPNPARRQVVSLPDKTNVAIRIGHAQPITRKHPDFFAASLALDVLGGDTWTSRLGAKLRDEMGLTYGTYAWIEAAQGAGPFTVSIDVNPANVDTALTAYRAELARFLRAGVTAQELAFAKSSFVGSQARHLATNEGAARSLARIEQFDLGLDYWQRYRGLVEGVSLAQVNAVARRLIDPVRAHTVIAGPYVEKP